MSRRGVLLFAVMAVVWGIPYLLIRVAVSEISPAVLVFGRTVIGAAILLPVVLARGGLAALRGKWIPLIAFAVAEIAGPWLLLSSAEQRISSSLAGLLVSSVPLIATLIAPLFGHRERMGAPAYVGLAVGLGGVAAIVGFDLGVADAGSLVEMALVAVGYAVGPAILRRYLAGVPSVTVIGVSLAGCAVVYAPLAVIQWPTALPSWGALTSVVVLGLVCTALAFLLFFRLIEEIGPVRSTIITYINPAVAAAAGILVLGETFTVTMGVGFALVLAGSVLATRRKAPSPEA